MIRLIDLLKEAKQVGTLYHYTSYRKAKSILKSGELKSNTEGAIRGTLNKPIHAISFTRDKTFHQTSRALQKPLHCRFVFDGDMMSNNYKIQPYAQTNDFSKGTAGFEAEETIQSDKFIKIPIEKYLIRVDVLITPEDYGMDQDEYTEDYVEFFKVAKEKNIKLNMVDKNSNPIPPKEKQSIWQRVLKSITSGNQSTVK
jgi:hypothetical protein